MSVRADSAARSSAAPCSASVRDPSLSCAVICPVGSPPGRRGPSGRRPLRRASGDFRQSAVWSAASTSCSARASVRMAITDRVNFSASLRRVRPNMSHSKPTSAKRAGHNRDPLRNLRAGQWLRRQRPSSGPGRVGGPEQCQYRQTPTKDLPAALRCNAVDVANFGPAHPVEVRLGMHLLAFECGDFLLISAVGIILGAMRAGAHNGQFTTFVGGRKRQMGTVQGRNALRDCLMIAAQGEFQLLGACHGARRLDRCLSGG